MSTWLYSQARHVLSRDGVLVSSDCYSGHGEGLNNPAAEGIPSVGPIPCGLYRFGEISADKSHGPLARRIIPAPGTDTHNRSGFLLHGDEVEHAGESLASHGCIIAARTVRAMTIEGEDLLVTP